MQLLQNMNQRKDSNITAIITKSRWIPPITLCVILFFSHEFILGVEERSLFIYDLFWLKDFLNKPSGILSFFSLFFTQFLHIPWLGALIWVLLLITSAELTRIVYKIPVSLSVLTYIPAAIFVSYNMSIGYAFYLISLPGYFFMPVLGYLWALLTVSVLRKAEKPVNSLIVFIIWGFIGYYIAGFYSLAGIAAACVDIFFSDRNRIRRISSLAGTLFPLLLAPILFVGTTTYNLSNGWTIGMPERDFGITPFKMQFPLILAMVCLIIAPILKFLRKLSGKKVLLAIQVTTLAAVIAIPSTFWFRDDTFKAELGMIHAANNLEWNKALEIFDKLQAKHAQDPSWQPTRVLVLLKDLSLIKTGQESERAYAFDDGSQRQNNDCIIPMSFQIGKILYLHYGLPGISNRWCSEEAVMFGNNYMTYKFYTMIAILLNDTSLAKEYLEKLQKTIFYRKWAKEQLRLCDDPNLTAQTTPYDMILQLMCYDDIITSDSEGCELFLARHFNGHRPRKATPLYDRVALFYAMESKQTDLFWERFNNYLYSNKPSSIGRYYQEAAYLFSVINHSKTLETLPFNDMTKNLYNAFIQNATRIGNINTSLEKARAAFPVNLRHTYFFYYYFVNELEMF